MPKIAYWRRNLAGFRSPDEIRLARRGPFSDSRRAGTSNPFFMKPPSLEGRCAPGQRKGRRKDGGDGPDGINVIDIARRQAARFVEKSDALGLARMMSLDDGMVYHIAIDALKDSAKSGQDNHSLVRAVVSRLDWEQDALQICALFREYTIALIKSDDMEGLEMMMATENAIFGVMEGIRTAAYERLSVARALDEIECFINGEPGDDFWEVIPTLARFSIRDDDAERVARLLGSPNHETRRQTMYWLNCAESDGDDMLMFLPALSRALDSGSVQAWLFSPSLLWRVAGYKAQDSGK